MRGLTRRARQQRRQGRNPEIEACNPHIRNNLLRPTLLAHDENLNATILVWMGQSPVRDGFGYFWNRAGILLLMEKLNKRNGNFLFGHKPALALYNDAPFAS